MALVLIVDDDTALRESIAETLGDLGYATDQAGDGETAIRRVAQGGIDAVLLDIRMPGLGGIDVLKRLRGAHEAVPVAILTAVPTAGNTIEAMRLGAFDHLPKPVGRDDLAALLARMIAAPDRQNATAPAQDEGDLVGGSAAMRSIQKAIGMLADGDATVLITGETGTGKEVVARAIHRHGKRARRGFVAINCAAIPRDLLESQLFGHVKGAFTGATGGRIGSFQEADKGTLFLDEIGDMDPAMQAKLLRVLQDRVVIPVGGRGVPVDVRIVAATHRDLTALVASGQFREDLYYRIGVVPLHLPPLRERLADILPLAEHFLATVAGTAPPKRLTQDAAALLLAHSWPGNVRELRNVMERAAVLARRDQIGPPELAFLRAAAPARGQTDWLEGDLPTAVARLERAMIAEALTAAGGNRTEAARRLNIHRQLLYEKIRRYDLEASEKAT